MATTTNYGWTTPDDTALVKDGAAAIRTLGSSIDTSLNTALGTKKAGLVLLNTTSFSAVASQSVNDVFSATYKNYLIVCTDVIGSAASDIGMRLRVSGTDASGANYNYQGVTFASTSAGAGRTTGQTSAKVGRGITVSKNFFEINVYNPFATDTTEYRSWMTAGGANTTSVEFQLYSGGHTLATSYTGFTLIPGSGTITGSVSVYGYNV